MKKKKRLTSQTSKLANKQLCQTQRVEHMYIQKRDRKQNVVDEYTTGCFQHVLIYIWHIKIKIHIYRQEYGVICSWPTVKIWHMMTSSNGNIFRLTGPSCGEFTCAGEFPTQTPVTRSFDVFFDLRLNKRFSKQPWGWWFETLSWSWWRHCNDMARYSIQRGCS